MQLAVAVLVYTTAVRVQVFKVRVRLTVLVTTMGSGVIVTQRVA